MKEKLGQVKELAGKLSDKTKKIIIAGLAALIVVAVAIALVLNNQPYETLFTGLGQEEAEQITKKLQEDGVEFKYNGDTEILVKKDVVDQTKAALVQEGYPKSGFTYDTFKDNAGMLTTDADKNTYKLYELQDRIGATIGLFDGVKSAKVTIALGEDSKYALNDNEQKPTATAVVTMKDGGSPTTEQAMGIQRLVAKSVSGMELSDVAVFDGNGNDVSAETEDGTKKSATSSDAEEIAQVVESQIANNVMKVLGPIYGQNNVRVSARAQINLENLVRETITYNTPEKIDREDKRGIIDHEEGYTDGTGAGSGAGGVAGAETNADADEYNTDSNVGDGSSYSESYSRDYLVNQIKEQGQITPGALEDLTVSVAINGEDYGNLRETQLLALIGNAAGIAAADQNEKIAVACAPFSEAIDTGDEDEKTGFAKLIEGIPLWVLIAGAVLLAVLIGLVILLLMKRRKKAEEEEELEELAEVGEGIEEIPSYDLNQELQEIKNDRGMELKRSIREFAEQNAEISAQLLKNWLNGGNGNGE
ncbi:MAG: flagellar M-ring protein FliF [Dorea sp.]|nr:flagellar M-ring protein FliF [Dorea sp.]